MEKREQAQKAAAIFGIGTAVPPFVLRQEEAAQRMAGALLEDPYAARWSRKLFKQCGVDTRYTSEPSLLEEAANCRYVSYSRPDEVPGTAERMASYERSAVPLALEAAREAMRESGVAPQEVTHLLAVSCTGFMLPGLDAALIRLLELRADVGRIPLNFMGCAAGLSAIRLAGDIASIRSDAVVLVVCVELCTLHIQPSTSKEALYGAAFFGDGASACVVAQSGRSVSHQLGSFELGESRTKLFPDAADDMIWKIGDFGFHLYLSPDIPKRIGEYVPPEIRELTAGAVEPDWWAIHPGGRGIIDTLQDIFALTDSQTLPSRSVLRNYGNMSSATLLFVLREIRREKADSRGNARPLDRPLQGLALAFGPGLNAELVQMTYVPANGGASTGIGGVYERHA